MLGLLLLLAPTPLSPPEPPAAIELTWDAPEGCPSADAVIERYSELLSVDPIGAGVMQADARIVREGPEDWRLELVTRMGDYTDVRKLRAPGCADLAEASAVLFAFALEPTLELPDPEPAPEPAPAPDPEPRQPPDPPAEAPPTPEPEPEPPAPRPRPLYLTTSAGPEGGAVPGVTARISLGLGYAYRWARFEGELLWYAPRSRAGAVGPATVQVFAGTIRACGVPGTARWDVPVCAGIEAGTTVTRVTREGSRQTGAGRWFAPLLRAAAVRKWRRLGAFVAIEGAGPLLGPLVQVDANTFFEPAPASLRGLLGVEFYFF